jgi:hypothetical protein
VFREFVLLCRRLDLYGRELLAVDGTRIKAVKDRNFTRTSLQEFIPPAPDAGCLFSEKPKWSISRRSKSSLRTLPFDSPAWFAIAASFDPE